MMEVELDGDVGELAGSKQIGRKQSSYCIDFRVWYRLRGKYVSVSSRDENHRSRRQKR